MSVTETYTRRGFYRAADNALLGGVFAGMADYFGFNLRVLRFLGVIAFIFAMPIAIAGYVATVLLIPARSLGGGELPGSRESRRSKRQERKRAKHEARRSRHAAKGRDAAASEAAAEIRAHCTTLEQRIAELERHITSSRYQLDREIRNL